jgi:hypothetical protein
MLVKREHGDGVKEVARRFLRAKSMSISEDE